jgi:hypothetical protein
MTIALSIGKYGGFYWNSGYTKRLCLGWVAFTYIPKDLDEVLNATELWETLPQPKRNNP